MQQIHSEPDAARCACGRQRSCASIARYCSSSGYYLFHYCECGAEWTERAEGMDPGEPISIDEVLEVHQQLADFQGTLYELVLVKPQLQ